MTISTVKIRPFSTNFMLFNFVMFFILKFVLLNKITEDKSIAFTYSVFLITAIVVSIVYIILNSCFTRLMVNRVIKWASYIEEYDCKIFSSNYMTYILRLEKDKCDVYMNGTFLFITLYKEDRQEYVAKLKTRISNLDKIDLTNIYLYKYLDMVLMSILLFIVWQAGNTITVGNNALLEILTTLAIALIAIAIYYAVVKICLKFITRILKRRDLMFFTLK
jgi:hypothetical protein